MSPAFRVIRFRRARPTRVQRIAATLDRLERLSPEAVKWFEQVADLVLRQWEAAQRSVPLAIGKPVIDLAGDDRPGA